ncbi:MAG: DUF4123 domain-containing protein [Planctomycetes bacterium]|jgi:hypothetical protein|nr:DUF4123 domain-containing protein [Planctomycetota bacterium]
MADEAVVQGVYRALFTPTGEKVYAVIDGASAENLLDHLYADRPEWFCLFEGNLDPDVAEVAPYVVELLPGKPFTEWVIREGWGNHWGVFAVSTQSLRPMRNHLRSLVKVQDSQGKVVIFRYYDPRILRVYLPTCNGEETDEFFGPVRFFAAECADPKVMRMFYPREEGVREDALDLSKG